MQQRDKPDLNTEKRHNEYMRVFAEKWITFGYSTIADVIHTAAGVLVIMPDYFEEDAWKIKKQNSRSC